MDEWKTQANTTHGAMSTDGEKEGTGGVDRGQVREGVRLGSPDSQNKTASEKEETAQPHNCDLVQVERNLFHQVLKEAVTLAFREALNLSDAQVSRHLLTEAELKAKCWEGSERGIFLTQTTEDKRNRTKNVRGV